MCLLYRAIYPVPAVRIFHFQAGGDAMKSRGSFPVYLVSGKSGPIPPSRPKIGDKSQQIPRYSPVCLRGQPPAGMAADKCISFTAFTCG